MKEIGRLENLKKLKKYVFREKNVEKFYIYDLTH